MSVESFDAIVVGAGFGGLGTAMRLAERGARVCLLEALTYPGGCAGTFQRRGYRFEAGATLFSGFDEGFLFRDWIDRHGLDVQIDWLDPVVSYRAPDMTLDVPRDRDVFFARLQAATEAPPDQLRALLRAQQRIADVLWNVLADPGRLPPFSAAGFGHHVKGIIGTARLLRWVGRPVARMLDAYGLADNARLRVFLDALCQITVQCPTAHAEAPLGMATLDYLFRGTGHVRGGIGSLASALTQTIATLGGQVSFARRALGVRFDQGQWLVDTRKGAVRAPTLALNVLPQDAQTLLKGARHRQAALRKLAEPVASSWGACMLYLALRPPPGQDGPHHYQLVADAEHGLNEGNHVFCSLSGPHDGQRAPDGQRTMTVSTHVDATQAWHPDTGPGYVQRVQDAMRATMRARLPAWTDGIEHELPASPRTFQRFTTRARGWVGGVPKTAGLHNYRRLGPRRIGKGLYLVGDSVFPGQSTLATALGGVKVADQMLKRI